MVSGAPSLLDQAPGESFSPRQLEIWRGEMRITSALCALALMAPVPGFSQLAPPDPVAVVDAGSRVRIAAPVFGKKKQIGTVVSVTGDTLVLRRGAATAIQPLATSDITTLEVSKGTYTRKAKGAL